MGLQKCALNLDRAGRELQPHGTLAFPCAGYSSVYRERAEEVIPWHWHDELEIVYLASGRLKLQIPGKTYHLREGDGFVINSNIPHFAAAEQSCELQSLVFHPLLITGNKDSVFASKYITPLIHCRSFDGCVWDPDASGQAAPEDGPGNGLGHCAAAHAFRRAFEAILSERPGYEFIIRENLSLICLALFGYYEHEIDSGETEPDPDSKRIQIMLEFIHTHYHEDLNLGQIAKAADIGERECLRCFKRSIQNSPLQYLLKYRTTQGASLLLRSPGSSVSEIAALCGFNSPSNFSRIFRRFFNCTPREYRRDNLFRPGPSATDASHGLTHPQ